MWAFGTDIILIISGTVIWHKSHGHNETWRPTQPLTIQLWLLQHDSAASQPPQNWSPSSAAACAAVDPISPCLNLRNPISSAISAGMVSNLRVPNLLGSCFFALHLGQNLVVTNAMFDNCGTAILLAVRLVFCSAISNLWVWAIALHGRDTHPFWQLIIACKALNAVFLSCQASLILMVI